MVRGALSRVVVFVALLLALSACGGPQVPLVGTVTDAYTGAPVTGAKVMVGKTELTTGPGGRFEASIWSTEDAVQVVAPGYESVKITLAELPQLKQPSPPAATVDTRLRPNVLSGKLSDAYSGKPVAGASISAGKITATSAADGGYKIEGVPETFSLAITAAGYAPITQEVARSTALTMNLRPNVLSGKLTDASTGAPLAGAKVSYGAASASSGSDGAFRLADVPESGTFSAQAEGYAAVSAELAKQVSYEAQLRPNQLRGSVLSAADNTPIANFTVLIRESLDKPATAVARVDDSSDGTFKLDGMPEQGFIQVLAPGFLRTTVEIKPGAIPAAFKLEPFQTKGLYVTAAVGAAGKLDQYLDAIDNTELNTLVIDLKSDLRDDLGTVYYDSQLPIVKELKLSIPAMDLKAILAECKKRGIYTIARVQLFNHDNKLVDARPDVGIIDKTTGNPYSDLPGPGIRYTWLDASNRDVWNYNIDLGVEAALMGFDEINYDYVRFPDNPFEDYNDFQFSDPSINPEKNPERMFQTLKEFLEQAHEKVNAAGAYVSIDVFGRTVIKRSLPIGQDIELMSDHVDYIMPMIYPSLWWGGFDDIAVPVAEPYATIKAALTYGAPKVVGKYGKMRPWLQDHTDPWAPVVVEYGPKEVRAQIDATADVDPTMGWVLYNSMNVYTDAALKPK